MTVEQRFLTILSVLAEMCGSKLSSDLLEIYDNNLKDLGYENLCEALNQIIINRRAQDRFPSIRDIREACGEAKLSIEAAAQELLTRVIAAIAIFGYVDPEGAREYMGEVAWSALPGNIGWEETCTADIPIATARAQLRQRIETKLKQQFPSGNVEMPKLGNPKFKTLVIADAKTPTQEKSGPQKIGEFNLLEGINK